MILKGNPHFDRMKLVNILAHLPLPSTKGCNVLKFANAHAESSTGFIVLFTRHKFKSDKKTFYRLETKSVVMVVHSNTIYYLENLNQYQQVK